LIEQLVREPRFLQTARRVATALRLPHVAAPWIVAVSVPAVYELTRLNSGLPRSRTDAVWLYAAPFVLALGTTLLADAYRASRAAVGAFRSILLTDAQYWRLYADIERAFEPRRQGRFIRWSASLFLSFFWLMWPNLTSWFYYLLVGLLATWGAAISASGLALVISTMRWIRRIPQYGELKLFTLPARTKELRAMSRLTGLFALYFSIQELAEAFLVYSTSWARPWAVNVFSAFVVIPLVLIALAFFFYPQFAIRRVIVRRKETELSELSAASVAVARGDAQTRTAVTKLYQDIDDSADFAIDAATVGRFAFSTVLTLLGVSLERVLGGWVAGAK
jgi:hypothetical protein